MNLMRYKLLYFVFSLAIILPGLYFLLTGGLKLGIDFTGGATLGYRVPTAGAWGEQLKKVIQDQEVEVVSISSSGDEYTIKTKPLEGEKINSIGEALNKKFGKVEERRVENVGPVIGNELKIKALQALLLASLVIVLYITFVFRKVPKPASSFRFGICAIAALLHDVILLLGIFAILGKFKGVEVDTLFVTALLTVIGFSVHDTIVVFDRIRENLLKNIGRKFEEVANVSVVQTLGRSLNTSLTVIFVLLALLLFGGETIKWFVAALLVGIISGTYSSIFNATALLVWWEEKLGH